MSNAKTKTPVRKVEVVSVETLPVPATKPDLGIDHETAVIFLLGLIDGLSKEVLSNDVWFLAYMQARPFFQHFGIPEEKIELAIIKLEEFRKIRRRSNPMSGMF